MTPPSEQVRTLLKQRLYSAAGMADAWPAQQATLTALQGPGPGVVVLKSRQVGISTGFLAYALWEGLRKPYRTLLLCKNADDASELLERLRDMLLALKADPLLSGAVPPDGRYVRDRVTRLDIGESTIRALVATPRAARLESADLVILDEFAFVDKAEDIWAACIPTIEGGGKIACVSTANATVGQGAEFARQWSRARNGDSGLSPLFWPWDARPGRDADWRRRMEDAVGDPVRVQREYPSTPDEAFARPASEEVFSVTGIDSAVSLGRGLDMAPPWPVDGAHVLGLDWGEAATAVLYCCPLEAGGLWVEDELLLRGSDPQDVADRAINMRGEREWISEARFDASAPQSMRVFRRVTEERLGRHQVAQRAGRPSTRPVPFGKYKQETVGYLRLLLRRAAEDKPNRVLAISPRCEGLIAQMRSASFTDEGRIRKGNDDLVDALIATTAPIARRHRQVFDPRPVGETVRL